MDRRVLSIRNSPETVQKQSRNSTETVQKQTSGALCAPLWTPFEVACSANSPSWHLYAPFVPRTALRGTCTHPSPSLPHTSLVLQGWPIRTRSIIRYV
eukprot:2220961-Pyramimonas_sp.AAC.1